MKALEPLDEMFLYDDEQGLSQISCFLEIEKFEFNTMQEYLHSKIRKSMPVMQIRVVSLLGKYYFKRMSDEEYDGKWG
jgi:hypothetical protein